MFDLNPQYSISPVAFHSFFALDAQRLVPEHAAIVMTIRKKVLFLQLPQLDNDTGSSHENAYLAAAYLKFSIQRAGEDRYYKTVIPPHAVDLLDDGHLVEYVVGCRPDIICATIYLWNVERTLSILKKVRHDLPSVRIIVGGPEVAADHPFLFRTGVADIAVTGEGETTLPAILKVLRTGHSRILPGELSRHGRTRLAGQVSAVAPALAEVLPPPGHRLNKPITNGIAYLETGRGCPLRCTFCCYNQRRRAVSHLSPADVIVRVKILMKRGAREVRIIDPTFNSNPGFEDILRSLVVLNRERTLRFFAELRADTLTETQANLLAAANFAEIEIGMQSRDKMVLRKIKRATNLRRLDLGISMLARRGIKLTIDVMCGLPGQGPGDIRRSIGWISRRRRTAHMQFLHTLLLPGTELRADSWRFGLKAQNLPPYRVTSTSLLTEKHIREAERLARRAVGGAADCPTRRFVGRTLPDLFPERIRISLDGGLDVKPIPGREIRRAVIISGEDLFDRKRSVLAIIRRAIDDEPHALWQFVLSPTGEEPLDLLDEMIDEISSAPLHLLDRQMIPVSGKGLASRRIFVLLRSRTRYARSWVSAAEDLLRKTFH